MTNEEYVDAISAPRVDPTRLGKKVMMTKPSGESETSTDAEPEDEEEDETEEEEGEVQAEDEGSHSGDNDTGDVGTAGERKT